MNNKIILGFVLALQCIVPSLSASDDNLKVDSFQIDGEACKKVRIAGSSSENDAFRINGMQFQLFPGATESGKKIVVFKIHSDTQDETKEVTVSSALTPRLLLLTLTGKPYVPTQKVSDYVDRLNQQQLIANQLYDWNNGEETHFIEVWDETYTPFVQFSCLRQVKFHPWKLDFNRKTHQTVVVIPYGPADEEAPHNQLEIYQIPHEPIDQSRVGAYYVNQYFRPQRVKVIKWSQIPQSHNDWQVLNEVDPPATYKSVEHSSPLTRVFLNASEKDKGLYYNVSQGELLASRWVYSDGNQNYFLAKVQKVSSRTHPIEGKEKEGLFGRSQKDEAGPTFHCLKKTNIPILLTEGGTLSSPLQVGFFQLVSEERSNGNKKSYSQNWQEHDVPENVITFMHATQGAFEKVDLSQRLLQTNLNVQDLANLLKSYAPAGHESSPLTVRVDLEGKEAAVRKTATKNLLRLLMLLENAVVDANNLSFETTTLTKGLLKYFLKNESFHQDKFSNGIRAQEIRLHLKQGPLPNNLDRLPKFYPETLDLTDSHLGDGKIETLLTHIRGYNRLKSLILRSIAGATDDQLNEMAKVVVDKDSLTSFGYWSPDFVASDNKINTLRRAEKLKLVGKLINLEGLDLRRMDLKQYWDVSRALERNLRTLKRINFNRTKNMGEFGINRLGDELIRKVGGMTNLEELDILESSMSNGQIVDLTKSLEGLTKLTSVKLSMPYHMSGYSQLARELKDEWKKVNSVGSLLWGTGLTGFCVVLSPILLVGDLAGDVYEDYSYTMTSLSKIPNLENLRLCLWGMRTYPEWTKAQVDKKRQDAELSPITITFGN